MSLEDLRRRVLQRQRANIFAENVDAGTAETSSDVPAKGFKLRLARLADEINNREDDIRPRQKSDSEGDSTTNSVTSVSACVKQASENIDPKTAGVKSTIPNICKVKYKRNSIKKKTSFKKNSPVAIKQMPLDSSVMKALEAQGYSRSESGAHLVYRFDAVPNKSCTVKESMIQKKQNTTVSDDPCFMSVAERKKLFEEKIGSTSEKKNSPAKNKTVGAKMDLQSKHVADSVKSYESTNEKLKTGSTTSAVTKPLEERKCHSSEKSVSGLNPVPASISVTMNLTDVSQTCGSFKSNASHVPSQISPKNVENETAVSLTSGCDVDMNENGTRASLGMNKEQDVGCKCATGNVKCLIVSADEKKNDLIISESSKCAFGSRDDDVNISNTCSKNVTPVVSPKVADVVGSLKLVKYSTPNPGCMYPSVEIDDIDSSSILEGDTSSRTGASDELGNAGASVSSSDSFRRELFQATNEIIQSYSTAKEGETTTEFDGPVVVDSVAKLSRFLSDLNRSYRPSSFNQHRMKSSRNSSLISGEDVSEMSASFSYVEQSDSDESENFSLTDSVLSDADEDDKMKAKYEGNTDAEELSAEDEKTKVSKKLEYLCNLIMTQTSLGIQAVQAINYCLSNPTFMNSEAHLEAEKLLLVSESRKAAAKMEADRLNVEKVIHASVDKNGLPVTKGRLIISDINMPIKMSVINEDAKESMYNNLLCLVKYDDVVFGSEVLQLTADGTIHAIGSSICPYIAFPNVFEFPEVYSDFKITIEVYNLLLDKRSHGGQKQIPSTKKGNKTKLAKKEKENTDTSSTTKRTTSAFFKIGDMIFSINETNKNKFTLSQKHLYHNPLMGVIHLKISGMPTLENEYSGFLTMYEVISGLGAWSRYWFSLYKDKLSYWKYPDQEQTEKPIDVLDLKMCITTKVDVVEYYICARPNTFCLTFTQSSKTENKQLETNCCGTKRHLLSSDSTEDRIQWCHILNETLGAIRTWLNVAPQATVFSDKRQ